MLHQGTVNGQYPGPAIHAREGDTLFVKVTNRVEYNITIHWHGLRQLRTGWSDGPAYITQCPIQPGQSYTYRFTITGQEGTLWWHAHISWLRATLHGAIIIYPKQGVPYPFPHPDAEIPIILGEWWSADVEQLVAEANITGRAPSISDAFTINGLPGALYNCSGEDQPAWTTYFMAAQAYISAAGIPFDNTTTTVILEYEDYSNNFSSSTETIMPFLPAYNDSQTANDFSANLRSLDKASVPKTIDRDLFLTVGLALQQCPPGQLCNGFKGQRLRSAFNNVTFVRPQIALLEAYYSGNYGVFTPDFPDKPELEFNYTGKGLPMSFWQAELGTKVSVIPFNSNVQVVLQNTNIVGTENHPIHLHGYNFYIVGQGIGNYDAQEDFSKFNLEDPPERNTIAVPAGGWAAIRFKADNPGVWFMHCHLEVHTSWGLAMAFLVENGVGPLETLEPPPYDLPKC